LVVSTLGGAATVTAGVISTLYGKHVAENLLPISLNLEEFGIKIEG
jgi:hypothetical protein